MASALQYSKLEPRELDALVASAELSCAELLRAHPAVSLFIRSALGELPFALVGQPSDDECTIEVADGGHTLRVTFTIEGGLIFLDGERVALWKASSAVLLQALLRNWPADQKKPPMFGDEYLSYLDVKPPVVIAIVPHMSPPHHTDPSGWVAYEIGCDPPCTLWRKPGHGSVLQDAFQDVQWAMRD